MRGDGVSGAVSASVEGLIDHLAARAGDDFPVLVPSFLSRFLPAAAEQGSVGEVFVVGRLLLHPLAVDETLYNDFDVGF